MKVLVVEDNRVSRLTICTFVRQMGYEVYEAQDGREGIEIWERELPEFILVDWNMPNISGIDLIKYVRNNEGSFYTYTILITARGDCNDLVEGFEAGTDDYLIKPVDKKELMLRMKAGERLLKLQSKDVLIFALANLAETRDKETGEHLERIRIYSKMLSKRLRALGYYTEEITNRFVENIYDMSPLHDIGKVGIPDKILLKKGKLTDEEFEIIKTHSTIGRKTLLTVSNMASVKSCLLMASDIAGYHHEKYDGTGYPEGLKGNRIPLCARIVALADVYDALRSERVYKKSFSHEKSKSIILNAKNSHFDPRVVEAFETLESKFEEISNTII